MHTGQMSHTCVPRPTGHLLPMCCLCPRAALAHVNPCTQDGSCTHMCPCWWQLLPTRVPAHQAALAHLCVCVLRAAPVDMCAHVWQLLLTCDTRVQVYRAALAHACGHVCSSSCPRVCQCNSLAHLYVHVHGSPFSCVPAHRAALAHACVPVFRAVSAHIHVTRQLLHPCMPKCVMAHAHMFSCPHLCPCRAALAHLWPCVRLLVFECGSLPSEQLLSMHVMSTQGSSCTHMYLWSSRWLANMFLPRKQLLHKRVGQLPPEHVPMHTGQLHTRVSKPIGQLLHTHMPMCVAAPANVSSCPVGSSCPRVCVCGSLSSLMCPCTQGSSCTLTHLCPPSSSYTHTPTHTCAHKATLTHTCAHTD